MVRDRNGDSFRLVHGTRLDVDVEEPTKRRERSADPRSHRDEPPLTCRYAVFRHGSFLEVDLCTLPEA
ncbi:hypothetical protein D9M71_808910 [compost metagenome]